MHDLTLVRDRFKFQRLFLGLLGYRRRGNPLWEAHSLAMAQY